MKMNGDLNRLKDNGTLVQGTKADLIAKLLVPAVKRRQIVSEMMRATRREFFTAQKAMMAQAIQDRCYFNPNEAAMMLRESGATLQRLVHQKIDKGTGENYKFTPFFVFSSFDKKVLTKRIKR
jgi:hypothetical protein